MSRAICGQHVRPAQQAPDVIPARGQVTILIRFEAFDQRVPRYTKRVVLYTTDRQVPRIPLEFRARIGVPLLAEPAALAIDPEKAEPPTRTLTIHNGGPCPVRLLYTTCDLPGVYAAVPREPVPPQKQATLQVVVPGPDEAGQPRTDILQIHTDAPEQPVLRVPLRRSSPEQARGSVVCLTRKTG